jgi:hypothetical protein
MRPALASSITVPVETCVREAEPHQEVLLFVKEGLLDGIEVVDYSGGEPELLPAVEAVEAPTIDTG